MLQLFLYVVPPEAHFITKTLGFSERVHKHSEQGDVVILDLPIKDKSVWEAIVFGPFRLCWESLEGPL